MCPDIVQRKQFLRGDGRDDVALADTIAAADFCCIGEERDGIGTSGTRVTNMRLSEEKVFPKVGDVGAVT
jgi:hypothetical protein